jgi:transglutaminase-like putative cysteine protease
MTGQGREQKGSLATTWPRRGRCATFRRTLGRGLWVCCSVLAILLGSRPSLAAPPLRYETDATVVVRDDRTYRAQQTVRTRINSEQGLAVAASASVTFIEGMERLSVSAATVERADGSTTAVDLATVQVRMAGPGQHKDTRTLVLTFPALAVGDTVVYTTVRETLQTSFEGHFSYAWTFARAQPWGKARHTVIAPSSMPLNVDVGDDFAGVKYVRIDPADTTLPVQHVFTLDPPDSDPVDEVGAVAASDRDPRFAITTFADHAAFGMAYWRGAEPRIVVTPAIKALADEITRGAIKTAEKVTAIDRWMKRNIRYAAVYLGRERWVPQAAATVLAQRAGDCKDHAVLMSALLTAVGIASEHVLVNLGTAYTLPKLPPAAFNHVMLHVPDAGLTLDPSAALSATGVLALQAYDKPALHVGAGGARLARTPRMAAAEHTTTAQTVVSVATNGAMTGETTQTATGIFASSARAAVLRFQADGVARSAEARLAGLGAPGSGTFDATSPSELREPYVVRAKFGLADLAELPLSGNRRMPIGLPVHARPGQFLLGPRIADRKLPFVCFAGIQTEVIAVTFAEGLALPRVLQGKKIATSVFAFEARYALEGRTLTATRVFTSTVQGQVCPAALEADLSEPMKEVIASLGTMMAFPAAPAPTARKRP